MLYFTLTCDTTLIISDPHHPSVSIQQTAAGTQEGSLLIDLEGNSNTQPAWDAFFRAGSDNPLDTKSSDSDSEGSWSVVDDADPMLEDIPSDAQVNYDVYRASRKKHEDLKAQHRYVKERADLQDTVVFTGGGNKRNKKKEDFVSWTVSDDEDYHFVPNHVPDHEMGLQGVDFRKHDAPDSKGRLSRVNLLRVLFSLWPGNLRNQLMRVNSMIDEDNKDRRRNKVSLLSVREMVVFLGVMLVATLEGKKGCELWQSEDQETEGYQTQVDISRYMTLHRHRQIRKYFHHLFSDPKKKATDPWWQVSGGIEEFNKNRKKMVKGSNIMVLDEAMSAFKPRTTATGKSQTHTSTHLPTPNP